MKQSVSFVEETEVLHAVPRIQDLSVEGKGAIMKQSVSFADEEIQVYAVPGIHDLSDEEKGDVWYASRDYNRMREADQDILFSLMTGTAGDFCTRGLENRSYYGPGRRYDATIDAICAVLEQQHIQEATVTKDPDRIAEICMEITANCKKSAQDTGIADRRVVEEEHKLEVGNKADVSVDGEKKHCETKGKIHRLLDKAKSFGRSNISC
jgi:hypothetical protein